MMPASAEVRQRLVKIIFLLVLAVLLLFGLTPSQVVYSANDQLAAEVFNSVIILDSYVVTRSAGSYALHVLVRQGAGFTPIKIRFPDSGTTYRTGNLTPNPRQHCPFADKRTEAAGIIASLERGDLIAYESRSTSYPRFANPNTKQVDLIVEVRGDLFLVQGIHVLGGCFWAQE